MIPPFYDLLRIILFGLRTANNYPHENSQTTYTSYMRVHKYIPYLRIGAIHIVDKHSHIFSIHKTSHPQCLIEVIHFVSYLYAYMTSNQTHTETYASHGGAYCWSYVHYCPDCHWSNLRQMSSLTRPPIHQVLPQWPVECDTTHYLIDQGIRDGFW
jgi:hypothetical protein